MRRLLILTLLILTACAPGIADVESPPTPPTVTSAATNIPSLQTDPASSAAESVPDLLANLPEANCASGVTPENQEGPYYKADSPEQTSLFEENMPGKRLVLAGYVLNADCFPIPHAWLDFWQANADGEYDNAGYTLRGHQFTDNKGRYYLETIMPGFYPERPIEHIHVKVQIPGGETFTTQLYFPKQPIEGLTIQLEDKGEYLIGYFNFVVK